MARKDLMKGLMAAPEDKAPSPARPAYTKGAIGAVSRSIADLKSRSVVELDPHRIDSGGIKDRLEFDEGAHAQLMASLRDHGQQVPILVRPHPDNKDRYQIVYGRRRVLALRDLGLPVKAMIRDLDDAALVMAQGQENTARKDLSFIEKANFARQMTDAGYDRRAICDALSIDKTVISRMLTVAAAVPVEVIEAIGSAPGIGRDRWLLFSGLWEKSAADADAASDMLAVSLAPDSDSRFEDLLTWLQRRAPPAEEERKVVRTPKALLRSEDGAVFGDIRRSGSTMTLTLRSRSVDGFDDWLAENIEGIHRDWVRSTRGE
ncbi:MAG: plasmid partitioning protein RepB [Pseudomonadota bacterium]